MLDVVGKNTVALPSPSGLCDDGGRVGFQEEGAEGNDGDKSAS